MIPPKSNGNELDDDFGRITAHIGNLELVFNSDMASPGPQKERYGFLPSAISTPIFLSTLSLLS